MSARAIILACLALGCGDDERTHGLPIVDGPAPVVDAPVAGVDAAAPDAAVPDPDAGSSAPDTCATLVVRSDLTPCATDADCTGGLVCTPYANFDHPTPLVCLPLCDAGDNCPLGGNYVCGEGGPSGMNACLYFNGPSDGADCCDGTDYNGNGYVDEEACVPGGDIGCFDKVWCGADGECRAGVCY